MTATAVAAAALTVPATGAHAARGMEVALQDDQVFLNQAWYGRERAFQRASELGVTRLRVNFIWANQVAQPNSPRAPVDKRYNWGPFDSLVAQAAGHGIRVQLTLTGPAPAWATANHHKGVFRPSPGAFAAFARDVAQHFRGRVDRYGIWNEPNWKSWLQPHGSSPRIYRALYAGAYGAIKRADPSAKVLIGETSPQARGSAGTAPLPWLRAMVGHSHLRADGYAHHPYDYRHSPRQASGGPGDVTIATLGRLTHELSQLARTHRLTTPRGGALPLYLTEYGYLVHGRFAMNQKRAASYLRQAFSIALHNGRVRSMLQYGLVSPPFSVNWDSSVIGANGHARRTYYALRSWVGHARGSLAKASR